MTENLSPGQEAYLNKHINFVDFEPDQIKSHAVLAQAEQTCDQLIRETDTEAKLYNRGQAISSVLVTAEARASMSLNPQDLLKKCDDLLEKDQNKNTAFRLNEVKVKILSGLEYKDDLSRLEQEVERGRYIADWVALGEVRLALGDKSGVTEVLDSAHDLLEQFIKHDGEGHWVRDSSIYILNAFMTLARFAHLAGDDQRFHHYLLQIRERMKHTSSYSPTSLMLNTDADLQRLKFDAAMRVLEAEAGMPSPALPSRERVLILKPQPELGALLALAEIMRNKSGDLSPQAETCLNEARQVTRLGESGQQDIVYATMVSIYLHQENFPLAEKALLHIGNKELRVKALAELARQLDRDEKSPVGKARKELEPYFAGLDSALTSLEVAERASYGDVELDRLSAKERQDLAEVFKDISQPDDESTS